MSWEFGEMFSYAPSTFLYLPGPKIHAINPSFLARKFSSKNNHFNDYQIFSVANEVLSGEL